MVEISLVLSEGLHYRYFDDPVRGRQRRDVEQLLPALLLEGQSAPQHHFIAGTRGHFHLDGLRVGRVVVPAVEPNPRDLRVADLHLLETDGDELGQPGAAVPNFLPSKRRTSSLSSSTWLGWCMPSLL